MQYIAVSNYIPTYWKLLDFRFTIRSLRCAPKAIAIRLSVVKFPVGTKSYPAMYDGNFFMAIIKSMAQECLLIY